MVVYKLVDIPWVEQKRECWYILKLRVDRTMSELKKRERLEKDPEFLQEYMKATIVGDIFRAMEEEGISKSQLAERLGKSRQYVGRVLNETANFTIDSISKIAVALERDVILRLKTYSEVVEIKEFIHPQE